MTNPMESELIRLRALEPEDVNILYKWENDTEIWKVSNTVAPFSKHMLRQFIENQQRDIYETRQLRLIIESKAGNPSAPSTCSTSTRTTAGRGSAF